jgi:hypothetical protein
MLKKGPGNYSFLVTKEACYRQVLFLFVKIFILWGAAVAQQLSDGLKK